MRLLQAALPILLLPLGCGAQPQVEQPVTPSATSSQPVSSQPASQPLANPHHPPIDCPMHKAGVNHADMKPFAEVEKYIAFLERPDRALWQKPDAVVTALALKGDETLIDIGAGSGYFAFRFAKVLPTGKVIAADVQPEMVRHVHHKTMTDSITNIEAKVITPADPGVPPGEVDVVFICDVLHHVQKRPEWLSKITSAMKPGARLALIEFAEGDLPKGPPAAMKIPRAELIKLMGGAGLTLKSEHSELLPYQVFLVFEKPR